MICFILEAIFHTVVFDSYNQVEWIICWLCDVPQCRWTEVLTYDVLDQPIGSGNDAVC